MKVSRTGSTGLRAPNVALWLVGALVASVSLAQPHAGRSGAGDRPPAVVSAPLALSELQQLMASRGWSVVRDLGGNLLLYPQLSVPGVPAPPPAGAEKSSAASIAAGETPSPSRSGDAGRVIDFEEARRILLTYGWSVGRRADGGVDLVPTRSSEAAGRDAVVGVEAPAAAQPGERPSTGRYASLPEVQELLELRGWRLVTDTAGNVILQPVLPTAKAAEEAAATRPVPCAGWSPDAATSEGLSLPVDREGEARLLAEGWLRASGAANDRVGAVRRVNRIFVVSIVAPRPSERLQNQLAIRRQDGCVYALLDPGGQ